MNDLINLLGQYQLNILPESLPPLQLQKLPAELMEQLKNGEVFNLKLIQVKDGAVKSFVDIDGQLTEIFLKNVSSLSFSAEEPVSIRVRLASGGKLIPLRNNPLAEKNNNPPPIYTTNKEQNIFKSIELSPLKPVKVVTEILQEHNVPAPQIKEITQKINLLELSIAKLGGGGEQKIDIIQSLQNIIKNSEVSTIKNEINKFFTELEGKQIEGAVSSRSQELTTVKTVLGDIFFNSKIKLPVLEKIVLNIEKSFPDKNTEKQFLLNVLKEFHPDKQNISYSQTAKKIPEILFSLSENTLNIIKSDLPFQSADIFKNIFNFYKAANNKDLSLWLSKEQIGKIIKNIPDGDEQIRELNNLLTNSLKENAVWKIVEIPMFDGSLLSSLKIALKKESNRQNNKRKEQGTRFVVETEFSNLGSFQFDGYSVAEKRKFDLIIRTTKTISDDFCKHVINLFKKSLYDVNYSGTIKINLHENFIPLHDTSNNEDEGFYI